MADVFDPGTITFNGKEVQALAETVFEGFFSKPSLAEFHKIVPGIKARKQVVILGGFTGLFGLGSGECDPTPNDSPFANSEKFWDPAYISDRLEKCWSGDGGLQATFFEWGLQNGMSKSDLTSTEFFTFLSMILEDAMAECILRLAYFGDEDAAEVADSGVITDGTPLAAFNRIDGFWKQIFAIVAADSTRKTAGLATKNAQTTYANQAFNDTDTTNRVVTKLFQNMIFGADYRLRDKANKAFIVTQSVADQYVRELDAASAVFELTTIMDGLSMIKRSGVTIYAVNFLDRIIQAYQNNGTKYNLPHRAILTTTDNLQIGTEEEGNFSEFDSFYDKKSKKSIIDFGFNLDAQVGLDHLIQAAY